MKFLECINKSILVLIIFLFSNISFVNAEETETLEVIKTLQKDLKTLEKAVYSQSSDIITTSKTKLSSNDEDVLTRHLLKLSEIEKQFQDLTNKFEEINFKIDKLSSRLSKVQADNQLRFQNLEGEDIDKKVTSKKKVLPGSSQPQDLGAVSYKSSETNELTQQTQSIDTTGTVITEKFVSISIISLTKISSFCNFSFHSNNCIAVIGLCDKAFNITSFPASIRFAIAISPSLDKSSTPPISLRYILIGSSLFSIVLGSSLLAESLFFKALKSDFFSTKEIFSSSICKKACARFSPDKFLFPKDLFNSS